MSRKGDRKSQNSNSSPYYKMLVCVCGGGGVGERSGAEGGRGGKLPGVSNHLKCNVYSLRTCGFGSG